MISDMLGDQDMINEQNRIMMEIAKKKEDASMIAE
jgi:hypothetical protein